jgi:pyruvate formate lyase activating enzyme
MVDKRLCKKFGDCIKADPVAFMRETDGIKVSRHLVSDPFKLKEICASRALTISGEEKSVEDLLYEIEKDRPFYNRSQGGVTLSGGEPLSQGDQLVRLLHELKQRHVDVSIETSLHVSWDKIKRCLGLTGTFLVDLKHTERKKFYDFTGGDAGLVLLNLQKLAGSNENIIVRVPVIPGFNHTPEEMNAIIRFTAALGTVSEIHFLPFHTLGSEKYNMLGMNNPYYDKQQIHVSELSEYIRYAESLGLKSKIGG